MIKNDGGNPAPELHPLAPFVPEGARMLMLGSFPPPAARWSMDFYYPNFNNDMWRIFGLVFTGGRDRFVVPGRRLFDRGAIVELLSAKHIAASDMAVEVIRERGNASDRFLRITARRDIAALLASMPLCGAVFTAGQKATETFFEFVADHYAARGAEFSPALPQTGAATRLTLAGRAVTHYRMPSSSRAYPMSIEKKAEVYEAMFREEGLL